MCGWTNPKGGDPLSVIKAKRQEGKAYSHAEAMLTLMDIAYVSLGIESHRIEHWTGLVLEVEKLVQKWRRSDKARLMSKKSISKERRKLRKLKAKLEQGVVSMRDVRNNYQSWVANARRGNTRALILRMNTYYQELFGEVP